VNTGALIMTLTKIDIVGAVAEQNGYTKVRSFKVVETLLEIIKSTLESGEDIMISGFGRFCVKRKKERMGRNPSVGEAMMLAPKKSLKFRCSEKLRDKINR